VRESPANAPVDATESKVKTTTMNPRHTSESGKETGTLNKLSDWAVANRNNWVRGLLMLVFAFVLGLLKLVVSLMALFQFGALVVTGEPNQRLQTLGQGLALYGHDLIAFLTCASEQLPFPFTEWPGEG
jgi:hypothetical protein